MAFLIDTNVISETFRPHPAPQVLEWVGHQMAGDLFLAAVIWGAIMGDGDRAGRPKPMADAQIAAVALRHGLTLATRNIRDFKDMGVTLVDPWAAD